MLVDILKQMFYDESVECPERGEQFNTDWSAYVNLYEMESNPGYREALRCREPGRVDERYRGGAFGCPGDYFRGARAEDCRRPEAAMCRACWDGKYRDEEWIDDDKR